MYVEEERHHSVKLTHVLIACIVVSFSLAAISIAYTAGRQSGMETPSAQIASLP